MSNIQYYYQEPIEAAKVAKDEQIKISKLQKQWLKKNKPTKCPDAYMDNPYKQSIYGSQTSESSSGAN